MRTIRRDLCSLVVIIALLVPGLASAAPGDTTTSTGLTATTTDALNLRTGPGLSFSIVLVLPAGSKVALTGLPDTNGFRSVSYQGNTGWAFSSYLAADAAPPSPNATATTTDALNLRSGAALTYPVITVLPARSTVTLTGQNVNGFRSVTYQGYSGWAYSAYLDVSGATPPPPPPVPEATVTTTDALNLRTGPGTSFAVIQVMPAVSRLILTGQTANGYSSVSYNGQTGWASTMYLKVDGTIPEPATTATTNDDLNMRSGPATSYAVITLIPKGRSVTLTGQTNNGFHSVSYNGYSGWAFTVFLDLG
ncbi:MAG: SH3 domain-containing protein, partial [Thermomicrobiales bacterium]